MLTNQNRKLGSYLAAASECHVGLRKQAGIRGPQSYVIDKGDETAGAAQGLSHAYTSKLELASY
jgi:hypothetical protein